jgi:excisionase family DNA binding protein
MLTESHKNALPERMLSVKQVASILSVHPNTVRRWEREGLLKAYRVGPRGSLRFAKDDVLDFVNESTKEVPVE